MAEQGKHTAGPWRVIHDQEVVVDDGGDCVRLIAECHAGHQPERGANARLIAAAPDLHGQITALALYGWDVERISMYDEEGVEGWMWTEPDGTQHAEAGDWNELPPWPDSARAAIAKAKP